MLNKNQQCQNKIQFVRKVVLKAIACSSCGVTTLLNKELLMNEGIPYAYTCPSCKTKMFTSKVEEFVSITFGNKYESDLM